MRREIPRSPRTLRKNEQRPQPGPKPTLWDRALKSGPLVVSFSGLFVSVTAMLITLTVNGPALLKNAKDFVEWSRTDQDMSGRWHNSSEGDIDPPTWSSSEEDAVFLDVTVHRGDVSGVAISHRLCKYSLHTDAFVEGRLAGNDGFLLLWDYVHGEKRAFAKAKFHIDRTRRLLDIEVSEQAPDLFPTTLRLGKAADSAMTDDSSADMLSASEKEALKLAREMEHARYRHSICKENLRAAQGAVEH